MEEGLEPRGILNSVTFDDSARVLTENDCIALLQSRELGRIAFHIEGVVEIVPVNYGLEGTTIVFRTGPGATLDAVPTSAIAFEVDSWDADSGVGWSVVAKGRAEEVTVNPGRVAEHLRRVPVHPAAPGEKWHWMAIKPSEITGRHFRVPPPERERA